MQSIAINIIPKINHSILVSQESLMGKHLNTKSNIPLRLSSKIVQIITRTNKSIKKFKYQNQPHLQKLSIYPADLAIAKIEMSLRTTITNESYRKQNI